MIVHNAYMHNTSIMVESYHTISVTSTKINAYISSLLSVLHNSLISVILFPLHSLSDCYTNIKHHYFPLLKCFWNLISSFGPLQVSRPKWAVTHSSSVQLGSPSSCGTHTPVTTTSVWWLRRSRRSGTLCCRIASETVTMVTMQTQSST